MSPRSRRRGAADMPDAEVPKPSILHGSSPRDRMSAIGQKRISRRFARCPLYPQKRTLVECIWMSAFVPEADPCTAQISRILRLIWFFLMHSLQWPNRLTENISLRQAAPESLEIARLRMEPPT